MSEVERQLNEFLSQFSLSQESLQEPCDKALFQDLMHEIPSFKNAAPFFFTNPKIKIIQCDYSKEKLRRLRMLKQWKRKNGRDASSC